MPPNDAEVARNINISRFATFALNISRRKSVKKKRKKKMGENVVKVSICQIVSVDLYKLYLGL